MLPLRSVLLTAAVAAPLAAAAVPALADEDASKAPDQILADAARDLATVKSLHVEGTSTDRSGTTAIAMDATAAGAARVTIREGDQKLQMIALPTAVFVKASRAYWRADKVPAAVSRRLGDRWVKVPSSSGDDLKADIADLTPKHIASCLGADLGTLSTAGTRPVGDQQAVVVRAAGDKPGSAKGEIWVAASGKALPLRVRQTGKRRAGHVERKCTDAHDTTTRSDARLSRFDEPLHIVAPKHALSIPSDDSPASGTPA